MRVLEKENENLREDVVQLKELLKLQRTLTHGTKFTKTSVEAAARRLKGQVGAKGDAKELAGLLNSLYEYIAGGTEITWESVSEKAQPAVEWLQKNAGKKRNAYAQEVLKQIRGTRVYLDEQQKQDAAYKFGSYNEFRQAVRGKRSLYG